MEKSINLLTEELKEQLVTSINTCGLPISNTYFVVKSIMMEVEMAYKDSIMNERIAAQSVDAEIEV